VQKGLLTYSSTGSPLAMHRGLCILCGKSRPSKFTYPRYLSNLAKITKKFNRIITKFKWKIR
jgi:hypothetical protein